MPSWRKKISASGSDLLTRIPVSRSLVQGLLYRWTEHSILSMPTGGGYENTFLGIPKIKAWLIFTLSMP